MRKRPAIITIEETSLGTDASCVVTLAYEDAQFYGRSVGSAEPAGRARIVGEATLRAVEAVSDGVIDLTLQAVALTDMGEAVVALAQVGVNNNGNPNGTTLVGSAMVQENDPSKATVKAVLDALNRRLESL
jgi:hypothetical protein